MKSKHQIFIGTAFWMVLLADATAQFIPADDFFHGGAMAYLSNNIPSALKEVTNGLAIYPNDEKLKKLEELLKQQQQQQQNQQQQNQQQQQNNQSKDDQKKDQSSKQQDQKKNDQQKQEQQKKDAQEKKDQKQAEQQQAKKSDEQKKPDEKDQGEAVAAGEMTPQEAKQLLDSQKNDELMMPASRKDKPPQQDRVIKDW